VCAREGLGGGDSQQTNSVWSQLLLSSSRNIFIVFQTFWGWNLVCRGWIISSGLKQNWNADTWQT